MTPAPVSRPFAVANWMMAALFVVAAAVQLNDPDPIAWIAIYLASAAACAAYQRFDHAWMLAAAILAIAAVWGGILLSRVIGVIGPSDLVLKMNEKGGAVEVGREAGGLAAVSLWMAVLLIAEFRRRR